MFRNESAELPICPPEPFADNVVKVYVIAPAENGTGTLWRSVFKPDIEADPQDTFTVYVCELSKRLGWNVIVPCTAPADCVQLSTIAVV